MRPGLSQAGCRAASCSRRGTPGRPLCHPRPGTCPWRTWDMPRCLSRPSTCPPRKRCTRCWRNRTFEYTWSERSRLRGRVPRPTSSSCCLLLRLPPWNTPCSSLASADLGTTRRDTTCIRCCSSGRKTGPFRTWCTRCWQSRTRSNTWSGRNRLRGRVPRPTSSSCCLLPRWPPWSTPCSSLAYPGLGTICRGTICTRCCSSDRKTVPHRMRCTCFRTRYWQSRTRSRTWSARNRSRDPARRPTSSLGRAPPRSPLWNTPCSSFASAGSGTI